MRIFLLAAVIFTVFYSVHSVPANDDYMRTREGEEDTDILGDQEEDMQGDTDPNYYDEDPANKENADKSTEKIDKLEEPPAQILTPEAIFEKNLGDSVNLPCETAPGNDGVIIWYKDGDILFQEGVRMNAKNKTNSFKDNSIEITGITADDAGQYKCTSLVSKYNEASITHNLKVRVPPNVTALYAKDNKTLLTVGDELVLTCSAKGYPEPVISWHKQIIREGTRVNERLELTGNTLTIPTVSRKDEGKYLCFADNKIGNPALSYIDIELNHPPIVSVEKYMVNSEKNMDTELKCSVKAKPTAHVVWLRNGVSLKNTEHINLINELSDHILILKGLEESDFGEYVCLAKNHLGTVEKSINVVKTPAILEFIKSEKPTRDLVLTWKVESKTPVLEHELQYRKKGQTEWQTIKPTVHFAEDRIYFMKYTLKNLGEGTYETRCRSQNQHGWSEYSEVTVVEVEKPHHAKHSTKKPHRHMKEKSTSPPQDIELAQQPEKESEVGASQNPNSARCTSGSFILSSIAVLYLYLYRL